MSYYGDSFSKRADWCRNYKKGSWRRTERSQTQEEYEEAYKNSQEKKLMIKPCCETKRCLAFLWAGEDSGHVPFCGNFEDKEEKNR